MNEISLSNNLDQITTEIRTYQSLGGQAIFEIGRRIKWVKENDLAHGEFSKWLKSMNIDRTFATRTMEIATELTNSKYATSHNLGTEALYLIATLPASEREKEHASDDGEAKKPENMTVRELRKLKKEIAKKDAQITDLFAENDDLKKREPEKVEVEVEPDDYRDLKAQKQALANHIKSLKERNDYLESEYKELVKQRDKFSKNSKEYEELQEKVAKLRNQSQTSQRKIVAAADILDFKESIDELLDKLAPEIYAADFAEFSMGDPTIKTLKIVVGRVEKWVKDIYKIMPSDNVIEGEIVDDQ